LWPFAALWDKNIARKDSQGFEINNYQLINYQFLMDPQFQKAEPFKKNSCALL
jgi:hypothetical protein